MGIEVAQVGTIGYVFCFHQVASRLEQDKITTLSRQLEVKELATRQKLRDFRERLKQSRTSVRDDVSSAEHDRIDVAGVSVGESGLDAVASLQAADGKLQNTGMT